MRQKGFIFEVGDLVHGKQGSKVSFEIEEKLDLDFEKDAKPVSSLSAKVTFMKIDCGIHVGIKDASVKFEFICTKCAKKHNEMISIDEAERVYLLERQQDISDVFDAYYIDMKNMKIDISEFVRQEIILHFPTIPVCSRSCKGLCPSCGADLNDTSCDCGEPKLEQHKPLAILKTLYNVKASSTEEKNRKSQNKT
ncbi:hypothetical protein C0416_05155 [bacterium]|nr:hypothetical protein [bacterium]